MVSFYQEPNPWVRAQYKRKGALVQPTFAHVLTSDRGRKLRSRWIIRSASGELKLRWRHPKSEYALEFADDLAGGLQHLIALNKLPRATVAAIHIPRGRLTRIAVEFPKRRRRKDSTYHRRQLLEFLASLLKAGR